MCHPVPARLPLISTRECFHGPHAIAVTPGNVFGVLSLIFWALIIIISIKYCIFVLRADNRGEGGILALTALATPIKIVSRKESWLLVVMGIFGAALLYGDGIITPAISVLGGRVWIEEGSATRGARVVVTLPIGEGGEEGKPPRVSEDEREAAQTYSGLQ